MKTALFVLLLLSCTSEDAARRTLETQGYTNIEITGYDAFACSGGDDTCTGFEATGPTGKPAHGAVGCGYGCASKGCTVRLK